MGRNKQKKKAKEKPYLKIKNTFCEGKRLANSRQKSCMPLIEEEKKRKKIFLK
jgi:hypothetical protein